MVTNLKSNPLEKTLFDAITEICEAFENGQSIEEILSTLASQLGISKICFISKQDKEFEFLLGLEEGIIHKQPITQPELSFLAFSIKKVENIFGYIVLKGADVGHLVEPSVYLLLQKFSFVFGQQVWIWEKIKVKAIALEKANDERNFFETILSNNPTEVVVINNEYKYVYLNKHAIKSDELRAWMIGKDDFEYCIHAKKPIEIAQKRRDLLNKIKLDKRPYSFEETFDLPDGKYISHLRMLHPVLDVNYNLIYTIGYSINITRIKEQERLIDLQKEAIINSPDGIAILDPSGKYVFMNKAHESYFDYEEGELIGKPWEILYEAEELKRIQEHIFPHLMKEGIWRGETVGKKKHGDPIYQEITLRMLDDNSLICATQDVSYIKHQYQLIKEANQKLELAIEANQLGMWSWNLLTRKVEGNGHFYDVFFDKIYENEENPFASFLNNVHPEDRDLVGEAFGKLLNRQDGNEDFYQSVEYRIKKANGEYNWVLSNARATNFDANGKPQQLIGFLLDTNEIKEAEHKIRESERKYKELVENLREVIFETDEHLNFSFLNAAWEKVTANSPTAFLGSSIRQLFDPNTSEEFLEFVDRQKTHINSDTFQIETKIKNAQGQDIWLDIAISIKVNDEGKFCGTRGSFEDITPRKNAEIELLKALEKEKELNELKTRFVNMVSHELRTPLAGIRSSAEIMEMRMDKSSVPLDESLSKPFKAKIQHIVQDVERITSLINDVLTMGQIDASRVKFNPSPSNLKDYIIRYLNVEATRILGNHTLDFVDKTKYREVNFDPHMIAHILNNVLGNAAKYSAPESEIKIHLSNKDHYFLIEVSDKGIGIPESEQANIFTSFYRSSNVENIPGTGLGLPIAKYFTDLHQGKIEIKSKAGKGTTLSLLLPLCQ
jgi:PAS domain S-box-containing protein